MGNRILIFLIVLIILTDLAYFYPQFTGRAIEERYEREPVDIVRIVDGDTFEVNSSQQVRLLCINTPERNKEYYSEAKDFLLKFEGKEGEILRDKEDVDRYERKLRYLFYNDMLINQEIIEEGFAHVYLCQGLGYEEEMEKAQQVARKQEKGLWKKSDSQCGRNGCFSLISLDPQEEFFILRNDCSFLCSGEVKDEANHFISVSLKAGEEKTFNSKGRIWNNDGDSFFLRDEKGLLLYYSY